jgi:transposase-like protein
MYKHHRFPPEIIQHPVWLYYSCILSHRGVEDVLAERFCHCLKALISGNSVIQNT